MKKLIKKIKDIFFKKEFFIFIVVGIINTFNGILFSMLYSKIFQVNVAFVVGYITSVFISYILNSIFTFKQKLSLDKTIKFYISYIPNFIVQLISVFIIYNLLGYEKIIAYLVAAIIGVPVTFVILKIFTFSKKNIKNDKI